ncbi:LOW QUALITY PROTEIN: LRR domain containing protein [Trema orientale]|uniref:LRR domain containing protein n=1 Tax=Trema orientale TaxID=63057 RepID=A0A2P5FK04_TREOI|nr:LOW QUALITY PROTEIN: LRR domain containing protein [Trema orientale]
MIGNLTKLESLDLSDNVLSGEIPGSLAEVSSLAYLDLSNNQLSGRIPTSTLQSFNASSYSMNLGLCGPPLTSSCPGDETPRDSPTSTPDDDESYNEESETWFDKLWFYIGLGAGFTIGFCGVCGNLLINTAWRNSYFRFMQIIGDWLYVMITVKGAALRRKLALH